jgi:hypothetical protein
MGIVMTSSTCTVHALNDVIFSQSLTIKLTGVLSATIGVDYGTPDVRICYKSILHRMLAKSVAFIVVSIASPSTAESKQSKIAIVVQLSRQKSKIFIMN